MQRTEFFVILDYFCPFTPLTTPQIKILKKMKKTSGDIIISQKCTKKHDQMLHCSLDTTRDGCSFYFSFWDIFSPFNPLMTPKNQNLKREWKKHMEISLFYTCTKNYDHMMYGSWDLVRDGRTNRLTHERTEKVTYRGGYHT